MMTTAASGVFRAPAERVRAGKGGASAGLPGAQRAGLIAGDDGGDALADAVDAGPDQHDQRAGKPLAIEAAPAAGGDGLAQRPDHPGEPVGCGEGRGGAHEHNKNTLCLAWASGIFGSRNGASSHSASSWL